MIPKYRPSLTAEEITHLISLCRKDGSPDSISLVRVLSVLETKIANAAISPAYTRGPKVSLSDSLGMGTGEIKPIITQPAISVESLYSLWKSGEVSTLTARDLDLIHQYRYENSLMTLTEEHQYESTVFALNSIPPSKA